MNSGVNDKVKLEFYLCAKCKCDLEISEHKTKSPSRPIYRDDVSIHYTKMFAPFTVKCHCGHFTIVSGSEKYKHIK